jgi:hypothetical protein
LAAWATSSTWSTNPKAKVATMTAFKNLFMHGVFVMVVIFVS